MSGKAILKALFPLLIFALMSGCSGGGEGSALAPNKASKAVYHKTNGKITMVELGDEGCEPCEKMKVVMADVKKNYPETVEVIFHNVKKDPTKAGKFRVTIIPTQVFLDKEGKEVHRHAGYYPYEEVEAQLKKLGAVN